MFLGSHGEGDEYTPDALADLKTDPKKAALVLTIQGQFDDRIASLLQARKALEDAEKVRATLKEADKLLAEAKEYDKAVRDREQACIIREGAASAIEETAKAALKRAEQSEADAESKAKIAMIATDKANAAIAANNRELETVIADLNKQKEKLDADRAEVDRLRNTVNERHASLKI